MAENLENYKVKFSATKIQTFYCIYQRSRDDYWLWVNLMRFIDESEAKKAFMTYPVIEELGAVWFMEIVVDQDDCIVTTNSIDIKF
jgi:hypothetical protein